MTTGETIKEIHNFLIISLSEGGRGGGGAFLNRLTPLEVVEACKALTILFYSFRNR